MSPQGMLVSLSTGWEGCGEPDSSVSSLRSRRDFLAGGLRVAVHNRAQPELDLVLGATGHGGIFYSVSPSAERAALDSGLLSCRCGYRKRAVLLEGHQWRQ
jgi:hypothetical protein